MREIYEFDSNDVESPVLKIGDFSYVVYEKHGSSYGKAGAQKTQKAARKVLSSALVQEDDKSKPNNVLLVGKVQSGKTSNLEALVGLAFDNGFNLVIMYGGYDNTLLKQTVKRFRTTFGCPTDTDSLDKVWDTETPNIFTTDDGDELCVNDLNSSSIGEFLEAGVPVFIITIKDARRIKSINQKLDDLPVSCDVRALIIDDEGDQASLNNAKNKQDDASATYASIKNMKDILDNPIYFSVTATPQANIFLNELSALRPGAVHLLHPAEGYCGAEFYHGDENDIIFTISDEMDDAIEENRSPESLKLAIKHFILASAILRMRNSEERNPRSQMVVHAYRELETHKTIYQWVKYYVEELKEHIEEALQSSNADDIRVLFDDTYERCFDDVVKKQIPFDLELLKMVYLVLKSVGIAMENSQDEGTRNKAKFKHHCIFIGAQLLERGITFDRLLTTYFTRWAKMGGNMDTNLQRARWFGYRSKYSDLIKLFTTETIADELSFLAEMEDDLWRQFGEVEEGALSIADIVVLAEGTKQKPTRSSVADYFSIYTSEWTKQRYRTVDEEEIARNNEAVDQFLSSLNFVEKSYARNDDRPSCREALCDGKRAADLVHLLRGIFDDRGFKQVRVEKILRDASIVAVLDMTPEHPRLRSFYNADKDKKNSIKALHQGRTADAKTYLGDKHVTSDACSVTLQVFLICPVVDKELVKSQTQYMFAVHQANEVKQGFMRG